MTKEEIQKSKKRMKQSLIFSAIALTAIALKFVFGFETTALDSIVLISGSVIIGLGTIMIHVLAKKEKEQKENPNV